MSKLSRIVNLLFSQSHSRPLKLALQVIVFFVLPMGSVWWLLQSGSAPQQPTWRTLTYQQEEKFGDWLFESIVKKQHKIITEGDEVKMLRQLMDSLRCPADSIKIPIKLWLADAPIQNAFAMPGGHIVVFRALLDSAQHPAEVCGVLAHELGHIRHDHTMRKVATNLGMNAIALVISGGDPGVALAVFQEVLGKAYSRHSEREADDYAVKLMLNQQMNPAHLGNLMNRMGQNKSKMLLPNTIFSTHPPTKERVDFYYQSQNNNLKRPMITWP